MLPMSLIGDFQYMSDYRSIKNLLTKKAEPPKSTTAEVSFTNGTEFVIGASLKLISSSLYSEKKSVLHLFRSHI
jgi:hypothetical protein